jgi:hypothetical protein
MEVALICYELATSIDPWIVLASCELNLTQENDTRPLAMHTNSNKNLC